MPFRQENFQYQDDVSLALENTISVERLGTYLKRAGFDRERAIKLYLWNSYISQSLHSPLEICEVSIRNSVNQCLVDAFGSQWHNEQRFFDINPETRSRLETSIAQVVDRIEKADHPVTNGRVVAGLSFEFWVGLMAGKYERPLWQTRLHGIFPNLPRGMKRKDLQQRLRRIKDLRNRVAHYEPVFERDLSQDHADIISTISYRCEHTADWVNHHSRFHLALRAKP
ncbi:Abi family protein [Magnetospirillum sp. 64-120]|uniref:Abi family protein n=1 Tax=Magnetospirillum sp. 64-120 TaxID=1895778 RepID=UPI0025C71C5D|nr:Abi family protein [Magnetospirillum sp. 64-120]